MSTLSFTEEMKGYIGFGAGDFEEGFTQGTDAGTFFMFHLTIEIDDVDAFLADRRHEGIARGWVRCDALGGTLAVDDGVFNCFVDGERPGVTRMFYRLPFVDSTGRPLTMSGVKEVEDQTGLDLWPDTTTLFVRLLSGRVVEGDDDGAEVVATGKIEIYLRDFARQLTTFRVRGGSAAERRSALARFGGFFLGRLWEIYAPMARRREHEIRVERTIDAPPERVWEVLAGVESWPEWNPTLLKSTALVPGAEIRMPLRLGPFVVPTPQRVLEVDPPRQLRWMSRQVPGLFEVHRTFRLEALEGGRTHFSQFEHGNTPLARALLPLLEGPIEDGYENLARALAARVRALG